MGKNPLVSFTIPCYNYGSFLDECIDSVLNQTFQDFEIVIADDGSESYTREVVASQCKKDSRIRVFFHEKNRGVSAARNTSIRESNGEFVIPLDADNTIVPEFLQRHIEAYREGRGDFIYCWAKCFGTMHHVITKQPYSFEYLLKIDEVNACSLFPKRLWEEVGGYKMELFAYEDYEFFLNVAKRGYVGYCIPEVLLNYRTHKNSLCKQAESIHKELTEKVRSFHPELYGG